MLAVLDDAECTLSEICTYFIVQIHVNIWGLRLFGT